MSICQKCNGKGYEFVATPLNPMTGNGYRRICDECNGTGEVEQTEKEYIQTCDTEQLAEEVYKLVWLNNKLFQQIEMEGHDRETDLKIVREWLKQPHTTKE